MVRTAVIVCGGRGSRLGDIGAMVQKCLLPGGEEAIIDYVTRAITSSGCTHVYLSVGHLREQVLDHFRDGSGFGCKVLYSSPGAGGTARALAHLEGFVEEAFVYSHGDICFRASAVSEMIAAHQRSGKIATVAMSKLDLAPSHAHALVDEKMRVLDLQIPYLNRVSSNSGASACCIGMAVLEPECFSYLRQVTGSGMMEEGLLHALEGGESIQGYLYPGRWFHLQDARDLEALDEQDLDEIARSGV